MKNLILTGKITAALSFIIGTILISLYLYFNQNSTLEKIGLGFIFIAVNINGLLFFILLIASLLAPKHRLELLKTCGIMLLNIPVVIGYIYLVLTFNHPTFV